MNKDLLINFLIGIIMFAVIIGVAILILAQIGNNFENLPPVNSSEDWKMILKQDGCKWYQLGCQKLSCVIDCKEINKNAKEIICVC